MCVCIISLYMHILQYMSPYTGVNAYALMCSWIDHLRREERIDGDHPGTGAAAG